MMFGVPGFGRPFQGSRALALPYSAATRGRLQPTEECCRSSEHAGHLTCKCWLLLSEGHGFSHAIHYWHRRAASAAEGMLPIKRAHNIGTYFVTANCASKRSVFKSSEAPLYSLRCFNIIVRTTSYTLSSSCPTTSTSCLRRRASRSNAACNESRVASLAGTIFSEGIRDVWQKGFADHRIRNREDYLRHKVYIEQNPVKAGCVPLLRSMRGRP